MSCQVRPCRADHTDEAEHEAKAALKVGILLLVNSPAATITQTRPECGDASGSHEGSILGTACNFQTSKMATRRVDTAGVVIFLILGPAGSPSRSADFEFDGRKSRKWISISCASPSAGYFWV